MEIKAKAQGIYMPNPLGKSARELYEEYTKESIAESNRRWSAAHPFSPRR